MNNLIPNKSIQKYQMAALAIAFSTLALTNVAEAATCVPGAWQGVKDNSIFDAHNGSFPVMAESEHFQIRWPANKPNHLTQAQANTALQRLEGLLTWMTSAPINWPMPFCDAAEKTKAQIFTDDNYPFAGSGAGQRTQAMWVHKDALTAGNISVLAHEFTHTMQYSSEGMRASAYSGWSWESIAEFMAHNHSSNLNAVGCTADHAWSPHIYYGSTRNRYCGWQFWEHIKNNYGFEAVNNIFVKTRNVHGQDPLETLKNNMGWSDDQFNDVFGRYAMRNVNWDYISPDGFNKGAVFRKAFGPNTDVSGDNHAKRIRLARLEAIGVGRGRFVVSDYWAPQRFGYNLTRLIPNTGATSIQVNFRGVVQNQVVPGAESGGIQFEPGYKQPDGDPAWATGVPAPDSDWRWGVVAIDANGNSRASAMQSGARADLSFGLQRGDREVYMVVAATPKKFQRIFWDQKYNTLYRYPWKVQLQGALPDGFQPGYNPGHPAGRPHANGGGWVANGAQVDASAYVGPNAAVYGGQVRNNARIEDYAVIWNGNVLGNAIVGGLTHFDRNRTATDNAVIKATRAGNATFGGDATAGAVFGGTVQLFGDLEVHSDATTRIDHGAFTGFLMNDLALKDNFGAARTRRPVEVTAPTPAGWPDADVPNPGTVGIGKVYSIRPAGNPTAAVRHQSYLGYTSVNSTPFGSNAQDFLWTKRTGLSGQCYSYESTNFPGYFLRHSGGRLRIDSNDNSALFKNDASFCERPRSNGVALESVNYPGYFWRAQANQELWTIRDDGSTQFQTESSFVLSTADTATPDPVLPMATKPSLSIAAGSCPFNPGNLVLSSGTPGARIYYTLDGSTPTTSSPTYSAAISLCKSRLVKAMTVANGYRTSDVTSASYTVQFSWPWGCK